MGKWMSFAEAVARAGSLVDLLVRLREGYPVARCAGFLLDGKPTGEAGRKIPADWWNEDTAHHINPAAGRAVFPLNAGIEGATFEKVAIGIGIDSAAVDALWPLVAPEPAAPASDTAPPQPTGTSTDATSSTPEVKPARRRRGRPAEHPWEEAAGYVDDWVEKVGPLERDENGVPIIQRGIDQMLKGFNKAKDPKPPNERQIRTWIDDHAERTNKWWEATSDSTTASVRK
jgi:hypothetical protein